MAKGYDAAKLVIAVGVIYLGYLVLKSWGIIQSVNSTKQLSLTNLNTNISDWKPLTNEQLENIRNLTKEQSIQIVSNP